MDIALIGAGGIASNYLNTLDSVDDARVVAICDIDEEKAARAAKPRGARVYTDHRRMFAAETFDVLFVAVPPYAHTDQEILAAERGIHLFIAKPIALTLEKAREVEKAVARHRVICQVGYMWRYADITRRAKELIRGCKIALFDGQVWVGAPPTPWWGEKEKSGGQVVEQATHIFDLVRYFGGEVASVSAYGARLGIAEGVDFEDVTSASMLHANGIISHVSSTCAAPGGRFDLHIVGEGVRLHLEYLKGRLTGTIDGERIDYTGEEDGYRRQVVQFLFAVRTKRTIGVLSDYGDAARTLALTIAVDRSVETQSPIALRFSSR